MASAESVSLAADLLSKAAALDPFDQEQRLERNLLVAAALREVLAHEPIVVGGTAEDFWTVDEYHETDLDVVTWSLTEDEQSLLTTLGFQREGRHWVHLASAVPVEMPESTLKGDMSRVHREPAGPGYAPIISVEDLYLDRVRQSTMDSPNTELGTYQSALAIAASNYDRMDWTYIDEAIRAERDVAPEKMEEIDTRVRRTVRRRLTQPKKRKRKRGMERT
jgi:hypothetical protein